MGERVGAEGDTRSMHLLYFVPAQHRAPFHSRQSLFLRLPDRKKYGRRHPMPLQNWKRLLIDTSIAIIEGNDKRTFRKRCASTNTVGQFYQAQRSITAILQQGYAM